MEINRKYIEEYKVDNHVHIFATSNSPRALKLPNEDRRWFVPQVSQEKQQKQFWVDLNHWLEEEDGYRKVKLWAQEFVAEHGAFHAGDEAPDSSMKREVISESFSPGMELVDRAFSWIAQAFESKDQKM